MGYYMKQIYTEFSISQEHHAAALAAIKALAPRAPIHDKSGDHFAFVETERFMNAATLEEALTAWRWQPQVVEDGPLFEIYFTGQKHGDEDILFAAIAPFVTAGSYIGMVGDGEEGDECWRWMFDGQSVYKVQGYLTFEEPSPVSRLDLDQLPGWVVFRSRA